MLHFYRYSYNLFTIFCFSLSLLPIVLEEFTGELIMLMKYKMWKTRSVVPQGCTNLESTAKYLVLRKPTHPVFLDRYIIHVVSLQRHTFNVPKIIVMLVDENEPRYIHCGTVSMQMDLFLNSLCGMREEPTIEDLYLSDLDSDDNICLIQTSQSTLR